MRYFFHLRRHGAELIEDEEGTELADLAAARENAVLDMRWFVVEAVNHGTQLSVEAVVVANEEGERLAAVPVVAVLPELVLHALKPAPEKVPMDKSEEYRTYAEECRKMAENSANPTDRASWLKLADAWLQMLPRNAAPSSQTEGWPKPSDEDSKASH